MKENRAKVLKREIAELNNDIDKLQGKVDIKGLELVNIISPFSVDDIIEVSDNYNRGKWFVDEILCGRYDKTKIKIKATKMKKDGSRSKVTSLFEEWLVRDCKKVGNCKKVRNEP